LLLLQQRCQQIHRLYFFLQSQLHCGVSHFISSLAFP
jgi:hypothetical protein